MYTQIATLKSLLLLCVREQARAANFVSLWWFLRLPLPDDADWLWLSSRGKNSATFCTRRKRCFVVGLFQVHLGLNHLAIVLDAI